MEVRVVQTLVFTPVFGDESIAPSSKDDGLKSPVINVIFQGGYWSGTNGPADEATLLADFKSIVGGPYLSGLTQYGSDGKASIGAKPETTPYNINGTSSLANPPFSISQLRSFVQLQINDQVIAAPGKQPAIYVVVTSPGAVTSDESGSAGYNVPSTGLHVIWASTALNGSGRINIDNTTRTFSHEIVETISDPDPSGVTVVLPSGLPASLVPTGTLQIGDGEPDGYRYTYRLNGVLVQPYWSESDRLFIVPDGNSERFQVQPIWNGSGKTESFSGQYSLTVWGDQSSANQNDTLGAGPTSAGGTYVSLDGQSVAFDPGKLKYVQLYGGQGTNTFVISGAESGQNVQAVSAGTNDVIKVENILAVRGTVSAVNDSAQNTTVWIDDSLNTPPLNWKVTADSFSDGIGTFTFDNIAGSTTNFGAVNLLTDLFSGFGDYVEVDSAPTTFPVNIYGEGPHYRVYGPAANKVHIFVG
jgi:hypothetical protein